MVPPVCLLRRGKHVLAAGSLDEQVKEMSKNVTTIIQEE
jgi:hypothetical protein